MPALCQLLEISSQTLGSISFWHLVPESDQHYQWQQRLLKSRSSCTYVAANFCLLFFFFNKKTYEDFYTMPLTFCFILLSFNSLIEVYNFFFAVDEILFSDHLQFLSLNSFFFSTLRYPRDARTFTSSTLVYLQFCNTSLFVCKYCLYNCFIAAKCLLKLC